MFVSAIIVAAGKGIRFKSKISKPLVKINGEPIVVYSLKTLSRSRYIKDIVVVVNVRNKQAIQRLIKKHRITKVRKVVEGGLRRQDSVSNGLRQIDSHTSLVLIHDAARPFIDEDTITSVIKQAQRFNAAVAGVPVSATIKQVTHSATVKKTLNREDLWEIHTPQVFRKELLFKAFERFSGVTATDESMLVEKLGVAVRVVLGSYQNIKITTPCDLVIAEAIARMIRRRK